MTAIRPGLMAIFFSAALTAGGGSGPALAQTADYGLAGPYLSALHARRLGDVRSSAEFYRQVLAADPENAELMSAALLSGIAAGNVAGATDLAEQLVEKRPGHHIAVLRLAVERMTEGDFAGVHDLVDGTGRNGPFVGHLLRAWADFGAGDVDAARTVLTDLEDGSTNTIVKLIASYHLGLIESAAGNGEAAVDAFLRGVAMTGGNSTIRMTEARARAMMIAGQKGEAVSLLVGEIDAGRGEPELSELLAAIEAGEETGPLVTGAVGGTAEALLGLASILAQQGGDNDETALIYARLAEYLLPDFVSATLLIANLLESQQQYALAVEAYESVPGDAPRLLDALIGKSSALHSLDRADEAIGVLERAAARFPEELDVHVALGDMLRRTERFEEAAVAYDRAVSLLGEPQQHHWPLYYQRGIAFERSKQWAQAEADFLLALDLEPDQPLVLNYLGYSWVEMGVHLGKAQEMIEKAVEQRPEDGFITDSLGWVLYRIGDFPGAVKHLERAVELEPVDPVINDHFGDALWMVGRRTEAVFQWSRALSFEPEDDVAARIRRKLEVGLDLVLQEEEAAGTPAIIGNDESEPGADGG